MTEYAFPPHEPTSLAIVGSPKCFPVRRIYCIGRNYAEHVKEMGGDVERSEPIFFTKAAETIVHNGQDIPFPPNTSNLHYEVELVVAIGPDLTPYAYGVGIDLTRRDLQSAAKKRGGPWARAKNFHQSAPCSDLTLAADLDLSSARIVLRKNGDIVQNSALSNMIWNIEEIIERLKQDMDLKAGDLIYTGTPAGVGPAQIGDELSGGIEGLQRITVRFI